MDGVDSQEKARAIAKAYFAEQIDPPTDYKVGDLVEVRYADWIVAEVIKVDANSKVQPINTRQKNSINNWPVDFRSLSGTYAEKQAKWVEFYSIKVGSKVRVVRKFESNEDGSSCCDWDSTTAKASAQGNIRFIRSILEREIVLCERKGQVQGCGTFPYFVLEPAE